jgi:hypothetical protein
MKRKRVIECESCIELIIIESDSEFLYAQIQFSSLIYRIHTQMYGIDSWLNKTILCLNIKISFAFCYIIKDLFLD